MVKMYYLYADKTEHTSKENEIELLISPIKLNETPNNLSTNLHYLGNISVTFYGVSKEEDYFSEQITLRIKSIIQYMVLQTGKQKTELSVNDVSFAQIQPPFILEVKLELENNLLTI